MIRGVVNLRDRLRDSMTVRATLVVTAVLLVVVVPLLFNSFMLFLLSTVFMLGIYAAAWDLLYGYTGLLSFGHALFFGIGSYGLVASVDYVGGGLFLGLLIGTLLAGGMAIALGSIIVRVSSHGFVIVTILVALIAELIARSWRSVTGGGDGIAVFVPPLQLPVLGELLLTSSIVKYYLTLAFLAVSLYVMYRIVSSEVGLVFQMIKHNEQRAQLLGYNTVRYKMGALLISGAFSGLAGGLSTYISGFTSASNFSIAVSGEPIIFTLLGGRGTLIGPVIGSAIIGLSRNQISNITQSYQLFIGLLLVLVVVLEPDGLVGVLDRVSDRTGRDSVTETPTEINPEDAREGDAG